MKNRYSLYFLIFCMRLQTHKELKFNWIFFLEKNLLWSFWARRDQYVCEMKCFKFYEQSIHENILIFCTKLHQDKTSKMIQMIFCVKYFPLGFLEKRKSKLSIVSFATNQFTESILFITETDKIIWQSTWFRVLGVERLEIGWIEFFIGFTGNGSMICFQFFAWS